MRTSVRRLLPLVLGGLVLVSLAPTAQASTALTITEAERYQITLLNAQRAALGLVRVRIDSRLMAIARARSQDMADKNYFAHQQPDGKWAWDLMTEAGITWYHAGEILAWNSWDDLKSSANTAAQQWRESPTHYAIIKDANFNYVGVGLAIDGSKKIWTAVFMKGPDRTRAYSRIGTATFGGSTSTTQTVTINWRGGDIPLSVLTSGLYYFRVQRRVNGGTWSTVISSTTGTRTTVNLTRGKTYEYRVRAVDRKGNWGRYSAILTVRP